MDVEELSGRVAANPEHGVHDRGVGDAEAVQQHGDGVHHHCALIGDDLDRWSDATGVLGGVDRDPGVPGGPLFADPGMRGDEGGRHRATGAVHRRGQHAVGRRRITMRPLVGGEVGLGEITPLAGPDQCGRGRVLAALPAWRTGIHRRHADCSCPTLACPPPLDVTAEAETRHAM